MLEIMVNRYGSVTIRINHGPQNQKVILEKIIGKKYGQIVSFETLFQAKIYRKWDSQKFI